MKPPIQNLSLKIYFEHEKNENSTLWCSGFPENYSRWPENLAQKNKFFSEHGKHRNNETFVLFVSSVFIKIKETDLYDVSDFRQSCP